MTKNKHLTNRNARNKYSESKSRLRRLKCKCRYLSIHRHQRVVVHRGPMVILYGADLSGPQQLEDGVVFAVLEQIHGVPRHWVIHSKHKVQHVLL